MFSISQILNQVAIGRTTKARWSRAIQINLSEIKYDTTCVNILPGGLPPSIACKVCSPKLDIHSKKSSQRFKKERNKHVTNRCKQYWLSKWSKDKGCNTQRHHFTRNYLNIKQEEVVEFEVVKKR